MNLGGWIHQHRVGTLSYDGANSHFAFSYHPEWVALTGIFPLIPVLPFVMPEEQMLTLTVSSFGISSGICYPKAKLWRMQHKRSMSRRTAPFACRGNPLGL